MTRLDRPALERLAALAALDLDEAQIPALLEQIDRILEYASALGDPEDPDPAVERPWLPRVLPPPRSDAARPPTAASLDPRTFAPALRGGWFVVPTPGGIADE